jgi:tRNA threonylcarbamoyl adenosine modification protein YeaZ
MKILAVEFSSDERSIAVVEKLPEEPPRMRGSASEKGGRNVHAFALVEQVLREAKMEREEIDCIALGLGPGSYTGIRAAISLAQGWQLARETKLLGISSVEGLAAHAFARGIRGRADFVVDAQRNEFYLAGYEISANGAAEIEPLHLVTFDEVARRIAENQVVFGPEADRAFSGARNLFSNAATLAQIAFGKNNFVSGEKLEPIYLREANFVKAPPSRAILD